MADEAISTANAEAVAPEAPASGPAKAPRKGSSSDSTGSDQGQNISTADLAAAMSQARRKSKAEAEATQTQGQSPPKAKPGQGGSSSQAQTANGESGAEQHPPEDTEGADEGAQSHPNESGDPTEAESGQAPDAEAEGETPPSGEDAPEWFQKRIDRFTRQRKELEEKLQQAQRQLDDATAKAAERDAELEQARSTPPPVPESMGRFANVMSDEQLANARQQALSIRRWAEDHPDGGSITLSDGRKVEFDSEQALQMRRQAEEDLLVALPERERWLHQHRNAHTAAVRQFPWLEQKSSAEYRELQQVIRILPEVQRLPHWEAVAATFVAGLNAERARLAAAQTASTGGNGTPKAGTKAGSNGAPVVNGAAKEPTKPPPRSVPKPSAGAPRSTEPSNRGQSAELEAAAKAFSESGSAEDLAQMFKVRSRERAVA